MSTELAQPDELTTLRRENRLRLARLKSVELDQRERSTRQADQKRRVRESFSTDWVRPYLDQLAYSQSSFERGGWGPATIWQRKQGRNYPLFRTEQELALLRFPSRFLLGTNSYAIGMTQGLLGYILGPGITYRIVAKPRQDADALQELIAAVQAVVDELLDTNEWYGGEMPGFEDEAVWRSFEDGEFISLSFPLNNGLTQWRFAEPEQLTQPPGSDANEYSFGVRTKPSDIQNPLGYYIAWSENIAEGDELSAERVTHFRRNAKRTIKRGLPEFCFDTLDSLDEASKLRGNMAEAAAEQASIVAVMKFKTGTQAEIQAVATGENDYYAPDPYRDGQQIGIRKSRRGSREYLPDSQEYTSGPAATNAEAHSAVLQMLLRSVCVRWNMPEWFGSADGSQTNRANGQTVDRNSVNRILREQRRYCSTFRRMIWSAVEHYATVRGIAGKSWDEINLVLDMEAKAPEPVAQDPLQSAQIAAIEIPLGVQSPQGYMQEQGRDAKQIEADNAEWEATHGMATDPSQPGGGNGNDPSGNGSGGNSGQSPSGD